MIKKKLIIINIIFIFFCSSAYSENLDKLYEKIDLFSEVLEKINSEYVDEVDQSEIMDSAINGLLQSLDNHPTDLNRMPLALNHLRPALNHFGRP